MERKLPSMGMSASQARLLSITSRLTNNEFRSQTITNSKLRLATESQEASRAYMDALNSQQLMFMNYDDNGQASKVELTPAVLYDYAPLKNQYMLTNSAGKVLVNNPEIENYENSDTLYEFLKSYVNVEEIPTNSYKNKLNKYNQDYALYEKNMETYKKYLEDMDFWDKDSEEFEKEHAKWEEDKKAWEEDHAKWEEEKAKYETDYADWQARNGAALNDPEYLSQLDEYNRDKADYDAEYAQYLQDLANLPDSDMYKAFVDIVGDIYNPKSCYEHELTSLKQGYLCGCYQHVLTHLLGYNKDGVRGPDGIVRSTIPDDFYTSTGVKFNLDPDDIVYSDLSAGGDSKDLSYVGDKMQEPDRYCDRDDKYEAPYRQNGTVIVDNDKYNLIKDIIENQNRVPEEWEILKSDFVYDPETNSIPRTTEKDNRFPDSNLTDDDRYLKVKTLKQKAIDLLYLIKHYPDKVDYESLVNFTDGDFKSVAEIAPPIPPIPPEAPYTEPPPTLRPEPLLRPEPTMRDKPPVILPPDPPIPPEPEYILKVDDQPKAQWYVNLWNKMNGSNTANVVEYKDEYFGLADSAGYYVAAPSKAKNGQNYTEYDANLFTSAEWLRFALEHGIVSMEQAQYFNPAEDSLKAMELTSAGYKWNNIVYTTARDFVKQDNQKAIAMAEVKYKKRITEIENKDTKYDQDLKKLDTEHSALQTEYDAIKEVLSKNVERSFKAFS